MSKTNIDVDKVFGAASEDEASSYLLKKGYKIIHQNIRLGRGEIDIIATIGDIICFIEVKASSSLNHGLPEERVGLKKQKQIIKLAKIYLQNNPKYLQNFDPRFDVIGISKTDPTTNNGDSSKVKISHIIDAFRC